MDAEFIINRKLQVATVRQMISKDPRVRNAGTSSSTAPPWHHGVAPVRLRGVLLTTRVNDSSVDGIADHVLGAS